MPAFLDSNVVLYALGADDSKRAVAERLLASSPRISTAPRSIETPITK